MTTPDTKMLSAERLAEILRLAQQGLSYGPLIVVEVATHALALTARVAELERDARFVDEAVAAARKDIDAAHMVSVAEMATKLQSLQSELAAARAPVGDTGLATIIGDLRLLSECNDPHQRMTLTLAADALGQQDADITRLARERDEAEEALDAIQQVHCGSYYNGKMSLNPQVAMYEIARDALKSKGGA